MSTILAEKEEQLDQLLKAGQNEAAIKLLVQLAVKYAENNNFERAETFRDQLYEVDSMALNEILKVNEAIEAQKSKSLTPDHRKQWARFFENLSNEEANAFFFALKEMNIGEEQTVLTQGETNERLFLVNQGRLKMVHERDGKQILIHTMGPGDIFGEDTFFSVNVCTASIKSLSKSKLSYLERDKLEGITIQYPQLEENLVKICGTGERIVQWLKEKGMDRRANKRYVFQAKAWFQALSPSGISDNSEAKAAELYDISQNGLSFYFRSKGRDFVRSLVGRSLGVTIIFEVGQKQKDLALTGIVQGVQSHPLNEYSAHLRLRQSLSPKAMQTIIKIAEKQHTLE